MATESTGNDSPASTTGAGGSGRAHPPRDVPVFNCIVLVSGSGEGKVVARVANLAAVEVQGNSEREVLQRVVTAFKTYVAARHAAGEPIEWLDPPLQPEPGEQQRLIAVHL